MCEHAQDLVEVLSDRELWWTPRKRDQATFERNEDGSFAGYERTPPFEYHDGYLSIHFATGNYLEKRDLTPLQEEAIWSAHVQPYSMPVTRMHLLSPFAHHGKLQHDYFALAFINLGCHLCSFKTVRLRRDYGAVCGACVCWLHGPLAARPLSPTMDGAQRCQGAYAPGWYRYLNCGMSTRATPHTISNMGLIQPV